MNALKLYLHPRILTIFFLGFSSGLPLALTASTLGIWLAESGISKTSIGLFAVVATPYTLKFLWSPFMDAAGFPGFSRLLGFRRGWLMATQLALVCSMMLLGLADPLQGAWFTASMALLVAVFSASQDIVIDAYRVEILAPEQQGAGAAAIVLGYRFGMIASSAGALYLAAFFGWIFAYWTMASLMGIGIVTTLLISEPTVIRDAQDTHGSPMLWLQKHVVAPFADFMTRPHWLPILLFILLYKLADAFMGVMTSPFLIDIGFAKEQIATILKIYGVIATIAGSFIGGSLVFRLGAMRSLFLCGIAHMLTNLMFVMQARLGADTQFLALSITLENVSGGMGTAAFVAYISNLCSLRFTATQYALLSSFAALGRTWLSAPAGWFAEILGWEAFFLFATALALPGLTVLWWLGLKARSLPGEET